MTPRTRLVLLLALACPAAASAERLRVAAGDGFELETQVDLPPGAAPADVLSAVVLIHGSGPNDLNEDLSRISAPGTTNYFFADVSRALVSKGFAVVRYNKRTYEARERVRKDPSFRDDPALAALKENPLKRIVDDARDVAEWSSRRFPKASIHLLGHSEGAYVALQVAHSTPLVKGVALVGFSPAPIDALLLEQYVHRSLWVFDSLDADHDGRLTSAELAGEGKWQKVISPQAKKLDLNADGAVDRTEFKAGNFANLLLDDDPSLAAYRVQEAAYPRPGLILRSSAFDVSFFQGEWDNQTPAYYARGVQLMNNTQWFKRTLHFRFFPTLGHALDHRSSENDLVYRKADPAALDRMAEDLAARWR
ncbi:MAG: alpha/beta fold hydrolase [Elusimicrobia bacterium]|nr:alpha/beta fold hydrolase [Elusimicrobiota bacterium]